MILRGQIYGSSQCWLAFNNNFKDCYLYPDLEQGCSHWSLNCSAPYLFQISNWSMISITTPELGSAIAATVLLCAQVTFKLLTYSIGNIHTSPLYYSHKCESLLVVSSLKSLHLKPKVSQTSRDLHLLSNPICKRCGNLLWWPNLTDLIGTEWCWPLKSLKDNKNNWQWHKCAIVDFIFVGCPICKQVSLGFAIQGSAHTGRLYDEKV